MRDYKYAVFTRGENTGFSSLRFYVMAMSERDATIKARSELIDRGLHDDGLRVLKLES